jgi:hypothetical protein
MNCKTYYDQANFRYELERLLQDLAEYKGNALSDKETLYLCAALIGKEIQDVANCLHIAIQSAQVFVSETINKYIKGFLENKAAAIKNRLRWHRVPHIFQVLGYGRSVELKQEQGQKYRKSGKYLLHLVSKTPSQFDIASLVAEIASKRDRILFHGEHTIVAKSLAAITNDRINQILDPILDLDEISGARREAYVEVIKLRWGLVMQDPITYLDQAVKIVQDLNMIQCHVDVVPLAVELMPLVNDQRLKALLQGCLAEAAEAIARETWDDWYRQEAILCYQNAIDHGDQKHCAPLFSIFWLNFDFAQQFPNSAKHSSDARLALRQFVNCVNQGDYHFASYRAAIQKEVRSMQAQTQDPILLGDLAQVLSWS